MSNGRKPVPYPTSLWTEPPRSFHNPAAMPTGGLRPGNLHKKGAPAHEGLLKRVSFFRSKYGELLLKAHVAGMRLFRGVPSRGTETQQDIRCFPNRLFRGVPSRGTET